MLKTAPAAVVNLMMKVSKSFAMIAFVRKMIARSANNAASVSLIPTPPKDGNIVTNVRKP